MLRQSPVFLIFVLVNVCFWVVAVNNPALYRQIHSDNSPKTFLFNGRPYNLEQLEELKQRLMDSRKNLAMHEEALNDEIFTLSRNLNERLNSSSIYAEPAGTQISANRKKRILIVCDGILIYGLLRSLPLRKELLHCTGNSSWCRMA